ncbi:MAG: formylglycine-generating enzyme family protein [Deltaproteobacteria bacterium]|nr:formylglycine-generating enzyme family protein [Deltaproteobacteria bacterium]
MRRWCVIVIGIWAVLIFLPCNLSRAEGNGEAWKKDMVLIPAGEFWMGSPEKEGMEIEHPRHKVYLDAYWIDKYEVTNAQFARFVEETGYVTQAEWAGFGFVMIEHDQRQIPDADWRHPWGPESTIENKMDYPVVQVSWEDAAAYARWAGKRLPTEAEWEKAARGPEGLKYSFGRFYDRSKARMGSSWDAGPVRVGSYSPNGYGVYDTTGNIMEWCADWYLPDYYEKSPSRNPKGPDKAYHRVVRGGSFFYGDPLYTRSAFRGFMTPSTWNNNLGFRCARDADNK